MAFTIKQGDAYTIPATIKLNGAAIAKADVDTVEFMIGDNIRKLYPGEVIYDETEGKYLVPVTQQETFSLEADATVPFDYRVKFVGGAVMGPKKMTYITVVDAVSTEVL